MQRDEGRRLRIALTADPELPVPPRFYGGIERIVDLLAQGLFARGHEVTLFAHAESRCPVPCVAWPGSSSISPVATFRNAAALSRAVLCRRFDLVHSFSRIAYMTPILPLSTPKLMTYQREISPRSVVMGHRLSRGTLWFSAVSRWLMQEVKETGTWRMVYNGVRLASYDARLRVGEAAPFVFLGRIERIKGTHLAIQLAQRTGRRLVIAGNIADEHRGYFETEVAPHLDRRIIYVGPVDEAAKNALLGKAAAFLMPILWEEPFGIVMAEAMACGTPVIGLRRGAVPEIVEDEVTGFVCDDIDGMVEAVSRIGEIDRAACRARVEANFSADAIVEAYLAVYREMMANQLPFAVNA